MRNLLLGLVIAAACGHSPHNGTDGGDGGDGGDASGQDAALGRRIGVGDRFACAIHADQSLWCWGDNSEGQLGQEPATGVQLEPTRLGTDTWQTLASGPLSTCAIRADHTLWCWGAPFTALGYPQGPGGALDTSVPKQIPGAWTAVSLETDYGCGIQTDQTVWCWGGWPRPDNSVYPYSEVPQQVDLAPTTRLAAGLHHICTVRVDGTIWCRGVQPRGELGDGPDQGDQTEPMPITSTESWKSVAAGSGTSCGVTVGGQLRCWGRSPGAANTSVPAYEPQAILVGGQDLTDWVQVQLGVTADNACATRADGSLWCWGRNDRNQSGAGNDAVLAEPTRVSGGAVAWETSASSDGTTCALGTDHSIWCVGNDGRGELGDAGTGRVSPALTAGQQVAMGWRSTCTLDAAGAASCAGRGYEGELGDGSYRDRRAFAAVPGTWSALSAGSEDVCGIATDGGLWCWGEYPGSGNLVVATPNHISGTWKAIAANHHSCAIDSSDHVSCWGSGAYGEVGCNFHSTIDGPTSIGGTATFSSIVTGMYHTCGISSAGTVCWGADFWGQLGDNNNSTQNCQASPVAGGLSFKRLAAGMYHTCGITTDDHAYCWGYNYAAQIGNGGTTNALAPVLIPDLQFRAIAAGYLHTCGVAVDGSLWCWGDNTFGQLGDGSRTSHSVPTRSGTDTDWIDVYAGENGTCATKADHSVWCWGANDDGELGDNMGWLDAFVRLL